MTSLFLLTENKKAIPRKRKPHIFIAIYYAAGAFTFCVYFPDVK